MDTIAVFKSRNEALTLQRELNRTGISATTMNVPSGLKIGCGLAVVFSGGFTERVRSIIGSKGFSSFLGFYKR